MQPFHSIQQLCLIKDITRYNTSDISTNDKHTQMLDKAIIILNLWMIYQCITYNNIVYTFSKKIFIANSKYVLKPIAYNNTNHLIFVRQYKINIEHCVIKLIIIIVYK